MNWNRNSIKTIYKLYQPQEDFIAIKLKHLIEIYLLYDIINESIKTGKMIYLVAALYNFTIVIYDNFSDEINDNQLTASSINHDFFVNYISSIIDWLYFYRELV